MENNPIKDGIDFQKRLEAVEEGLKYFLEKETDRIVAELKTLVPDRVTRPNETMQGWKREREGKLIRLRGILNRLKGAAVAVILGLSLTYCATLCPAGELDLPELPALPGDTDANRGTDQIRPNPIEQTWERARQTDRLQMNPDTQKYQHKPDGYEWRQNPFKGRAE